MDKKVYMQRSFWTWESFVPDLCCHAKLMGTLLSCPPSSGPATISGKPNVTKTSLEFLRGTTRPSSKN